MDVRPSLHRASRGGQTAGAALLILIAAGCSAFSAEERASLVTEPPRVETDPSPTSRPPAMFAPSGAIEVGVVVRITDGDTVRVVIDGEEYRLRYIGIDTPESVAPGTPVEPFAKAAATANGRLVAGEEVVLEKDVSQTDRFDRLLRYVWLAPDLENRATDDDAWRLVNLELVRAGLAEAVEYPPDVRYAAIFEAAEHEAREAGRGMWAS